MNDRVIRGTFHRREDATEFLSNLEYLEGPHFELIVRGSEAEPEYVVIKYLKEPL